jgi:predicted Zn-dependent protease
MEIILAAKWNKTLSSSTSQAAAAAVLALFWLSACAPLQPVTPPPSRTTTTSTEAPVRQDSSDQAPAAFPGDRESASATSATAASPKTVASLNLVDQARELLERGRPDEAIRVLERSLRIDPGNPQSAFYLAEAWIQKGNRSQAEAFHRVANVHLSHDPRWEQRLRSQRRRLEQQ